MQHPIIKIKQTTGFSHGFFLHLQISTEKIRRKSCIHTGGNNSIFTHHKTIAIIKIRFQ